MGEHRGDEPQQPATGPRTSPSDDILEGVFDIQVTRCFIYSIVNRARLVRSPKHIAARIWD